MVYSNCNPKANETEFQRWYEETHPPEVLLIPGIVAASCYQLSATQMIPLPSLDGRRYLAIYDLEADDLASFCQSVMTSAPERTDIGVLQREPLPITVLFEPAGKRQSINRETL